MNFDLDYAFLPFTELGNTHRFSINYLFGKRNTVQNPKIIEYQRNIELIEFIKILNLPKPDLIQNIQKTAHFDTKTQPVFQGYSIDAVIVSPKKDIVSQQPAIFSSIKRDVPIEPVKYSYEKSDGMTQDEFEFKQFLKNGYSRIVYFQSNTAKSVFISGSFNDWNPVSLTYDFLTGIWFCELDIPAGRYFYKFIVDGQIIPDANNPHFQLDGFEGINSILYISNK